ncbi:hypothetical protein VPH49_20145 [Pseudomonas luteola]|uniref:hypothetical protein n=1 Tax=Pseudomonas luteola TaxID=47886 RepID=UPI003A8841E3
MTIFRYLCIGLGSLVGGVAALCGAVYGVWSVLHGLGYLVTAAASHFGLSPVQLAGNRFEGISEPGYFLVGIHFLLVLVAAVALLLLCLWALVVLGEVIDRHVLPNSLKTRR